MTQHRTSIDPQQMMMMTAWTTECVALLKGIFKGNVTNITLMFTYKLIISLKTIKYITTKMSITLPTADAIFKHYIKDHSVTVRLEEQQETLASYVK